MSGRRYQIPALGRPFDLGMLYDRRSEKLILGKTLWSPDHLSQAISIIPKPYTNSEVLAEDTIDDKISALNVEAGLKLSFLGGLVDLQGAGKYLNDRKTSSRHSRVVLKYETTTKLRQLTMEHLGRGKVQYPEVFDQDIATDVVVGILYGAKAFLIFDQEVSKDKDVNEVHGNMKVLVKELPGVPIGGNGSVDITEDQKNKAKAMCCKMYGDFRTEESPTTYEEAVRVYKRLPSLIGDEGQHAVAVQVYLCPLSEIDSKGQQRVREISANYISKTCEIQEHIQWIEAQCSDLLREDVCLSFPRVKRQITSFKDNISRYRTFFQKKLLFLLPSIRGGGAEESALADISQEKESSPFAKSRLDTWIDKKRKEIKRLQGMIAFLGDTPFVGPEDVENQCCDPSNENIVCCTFKIAKEDDPQVLSMDKHLTGKGPAELKKGVPTDIDDKNVNKRIRQTLKQFVELKAANEDQEEVKFLATEECLSDNFSGKLGAFVYLYEDGDLVDDDFESSPKPEKLEAENVQDDSIELRWNDPHFSQNKIKKYKVQYKKDEEANSAWITQYSACSNEAEKTTTVSGLHPAIKYLFRVCAMRQIVVSQYSNILCETTKPTSPPGKPSFKGATSDTITIAFTKPKNIGNGIKIEKYKIEWSSSSQQMEQVPKYTEGASLTCTIRGLQAGVPHNFRVTAICGRKGESGPGEVSDPLQTEVPLTKFDAIKTLALCKIAQPPEDGKPAVYTLPLTLVHEDSSSQLRKFVINLEEDRRRSLSQSIPEKVIMVVGSTGSGKTTTVNAMINHVLGVEWKDDFRFKMIHELSCNQETETIGNQTHSHTQFVTCYTLPYMEGLKFPYNLTVVDTPGFGDTRGIERDKVITEQIRRFFNTEGLAGIDHVDAICFVAQAGNPRLTPTQRYVCDSILSMFGKDIQKNILVLFTFADGQRPQSLSAMLEARILENENHYFKFNNSALFVRNSREDDEYIFDRMFWKMGIKNFEFFAGLAQMEPKSLILTKQVLSERAQLEVRLSGLREKVELGGNKLSELHRLKRTSDQHAADINANRNFKFSFKEPRRKQIRLKTGTYTTNCLTCNYTCHYPCSIPRSEDKSGCAAMEGTESCRQCPNKCHWTKHVSDKYRFETEYITVEKEYDEIKDRYDTAVQGQTQVEAVIKQVEEEFKRTDQIVLSFVAGMRRGLEKLSEIALKKDPLEQVDYLDLLMESEKSQAKPGWKDRVKSLQKTRDEAVQINRLRKPGFDPWEEYRENLAQIALKKDPLEQVDYLDLLIESEKSQAKPGWKDRVKSLQKTRDEEVQINRLRKPGFDPWEEYRENLAQIALKKDPLEQVDYLDLLIESEKSQAKPGWKDRVKSLQKTRDEEVQINRLRKPGFDPWEEYRENLAQIALKKDPLEQVDYLDLLIESEKSQAKPGWKDRVKSLQKTRDEAVQINRLRKPGFDPWEEYRENEETREFFCKQTEETQKGFLSPFCNKTKEAAGKTKEAFFG